MSDSLLRSLLTEIQLSPWFALQADEATDFSNNEQMCIAIRWITEDYDIREDPIGLFQVPKTDSDTLTTALRDVLVRCIPPLSKCRGQAYDGASNMSGRLRGVAAQIKSLEPSALDVHCFATCLNSCLQDAARNCTVVRDTIEPVREIAKLIKFSPKRSHLFQAMRLQLSPNTNDSRPLCPTRRTVRTDAVAAVLTNYEALCATMNEVNQTCRDENAFKAGGFARQLQQFQTFFGLQLCQVIFAPTEQLSRTLQKKDISIQEAREAARVTESFLGSQRSDDKYNRLYDRVVMESSSITDEAILSRKRKNPLKS